MLRVYLNGDSQTCGSDLPLRHTGSLLHTESYEEDAVCSYAGHLVHRLGGEVIANPAVGGASNERILRTTNQMLDDCERNNEPYPDFMVIGWSEFSRYDWFYNGKLRTAGSMEDGFSIDDLLHNPIHSKRWKWQDKELGRETFGPGQINYQYNQMFNLHCRLEYLKIPHLFLNAHAGFYDDYGFIHRGNTLAVGLVDIGWDNCFWNVLEREDASFTSWAGKRGFKGVFGYHYEHQAHIDFSKVMYDYIQEHDLLNMYNLETV
jgi:hypothetical protein